MMMKATDTSNERSERPAMSDVSLILNVLWVVCGGLWMAVGWLIAAVIMAITIVGLPGYGGSPRLWLAPPKVRTVP